MNKNIQIVGLLVAFSTLLVHSQSITDPAQDEWDEFKTTYSKSYENQVEEKHRMKVYLNNRKTIAMHNRNPNIRFKLRMNTFGDQTPQEFKSRMNGFSMELQANQTNGKRQMFMAPLNFVAPDEIDWRDQGYVTPVKNQKQCGSCWAFSATGSLEGQHMRKTGQLVSLSEQNLIDCSSSQGNKGCNGGIMDNAFKYVEDHGGVDTEQSYPYEGRDDTCRYSSNNIGATCIGYTDIPQGDEHALMEAVASVGPISVAIDASQDTFMYYHSGVYFDEKCSSRNLDHGVLVVGYGTENGQDYWLVKNSWGPEWGEEGYIKMARNANNQCGIATLASYPIV